MDSIGLLINGLKPKLDPCMCYLRTAAFEERNQLQHSVLGQKCWKTAEDPWFRTWYNDSFLRGSSWFTASNMEVSGKNIRNILILMKVFIHSREFVMCLDHIKDIVYKFNLIERVSTHCMCLIKIAVQTKKNMDQWVHNF